MRKIYENIERIHITGSVTQLTEAINSMDIAMQNMTDSSDQLASILIKYSAGNKGQQYEKIVQASVHLRDKLYEASLEMNDMQKQIVMYQNKIFKYEDMSEGAAIPNAYMVRKRPISVDRSMLQFNRNEMIVVVSAIKNYKDKIITLLKTLVNKKNTISKIWRDPQYDLFSSFIDEIARSIVEALRLYDEYVKILEMKIKELS